MSKGDKQRPTTITYDEYIDNWEKAFGKKEKRIFKIEIEDVDPEEIDEYLKDVVKQIKQEEDKKFVKNVEDALGRESKSGVTLLNDNTLEAQLEKVKMES